MADNKFTVNFKPQTMKIAAAEIDYALINKQNATENLLLEMQEKELYKVNTESIKLAPSYATETLVADTEISHVDPAETLFNRHFALINSIRAKIDANDEQTALHRRLQKFIDRWQDDPDVNKELGRYYSISNNQVTIVRDSSQLQESAVKLSSDNGSSALFKLSRFAMDDFHRMSGLRRDVAQLKRTKALQLRASLKRQSKLEKEIEEARADFENSEKSRLQADENYAIARGLLEEQLQAVDDAFVERKRILSSPLGLCFVRVSDIPMQIDYHVTALIAEPSAGSLPASCLEAPELPDRLEPFIELLADQPMSSWRRLKPYWRYLPRDWLARPPSRPAVQFHHTISLMPPVFHVLAKALPVLPKRPIEPKNRLGLADGMKRLTDEVTLEQLINTRNSRLRTTARRLQDELEKASSCLLEQLFELPAELRYEWSRLAEDDELNTEKLDSWPGYHNIARESTGLMLREVHQWLHLQLDGNAVPDARTAVRTLVRACLLHAVNDDPEDLLTGKVVEFPGFIKPGVMMTAELDRIPQLSAMLKVYDGKQQLLAEAKVVDSKATQASIEIVSAYTTTPESFTSWTVVSHKALYHAGFD